MTRSTTAKTILATVAGVMALGAAASAVAQPYGYSGYGGSSYGGAYGNSYSYDPCRRDQTNRGTTGALIGGALGAVIGSNAAARNARTEGALVGGALGAVIGGSVGNSSAACRNQYQTPGSSAYYPYGGQPYGGQSYGSNSYGSYGGQPYGSSAYGSSGYYGNQGQYAGDRGYGGYRGSRYDDRNAYDSYGATYPIAQGQVDASGCTLAESPIYLPDGRVQKRFVRVCQDASGRYQVVE